jgi:DNA polymerase-3 subunit epsilon
MLDNYSNMDRDTSIQNIIFVAFDFETTGLYPQQDDIIEFGAVKFTVVDGPIAEFRTFVDPNRPVPPDASEISGITTEMLIGQPSLSIVVPQFKHFIEGTVLVAHNAGFDLSFLRAALAKIPSSDIDNFVIDTQQLAKRAFPGQKSYGLQNLASFLQFPPNQAHRALDDAHMCMKLFISCASALSFMGEITLHELLT